MGGKLTDAADAIATATRTGRDAVPQYTILAGNAISLFAGGR